jgi:hypothetical protein
MARVSFSQYSMWNSCPQQYKLSYIDGLSISNANIHLIFGTAMHETLQKFLDVMYNATKSSAMAMDLDMLLKDRLVENFNKEREKLGENEFPCTKEELEEFFGDGRKILQYFKSKLVLFFSKKGYELVAIELPLNMQIKDNVHFIGFVDIIIKEIATKKITIIDFKTSTAGWSKYQKSDPIKNAQILLYKKFYAEKYKIDEDKVNVEFHILKRKVKEDADYPIPRISKHVPASGKPSINKAWKGFMEFVDSVFDVDGKYKEIDYPAKKGKQCDWCEFKERKLCSVWS